MSDLTDRMESDFSRVFLRKSDFAVEATLTFGSEAKTISVVFDENYVGQDSYGEVTTGGPAVICATSDIENSAGEIPGENSDAATLEIDDVTYNVIKGARAGDTTILTLSRDA